MPHPSVRFHPQAIEEAEAAQRWYGERSAIAAGAFTAELSHAVDMVVEAPDRWPRSARGTRRYVFPRFPFSLVYRVREDMVEVVAVAHHKRRPGYWRTR
jgi:plasmid stabilization system protein ParE